MPEYSEKNVKCPFWSKSSARENKIFCEGPVADARLQLWFKGSERKRKLFVSAHCCARYEKCPIYKMTEAKYNEE